MTLCLTMIVKDEAAVIWRSLASARPFISSWIVVDTGSTDATREIVRDLLKEIPGELHDRPWRDFATNRNEALALARGKAAYNLVLDADDALVPTSGDFRMPPLTADAYRLSIKYGDTVYERPQIFRNDHPFYYKGVLHEALVSDTAYTTARLAGLTYYCIGAGARSADPHKYRKDAEVLTAALQAEPDNARYAFYLAQSWRDAGEFQRAADAYAHRITLGGWAEEVYVALYERAAMLDRLGLDDHQILAAFLKAYEFRPSRAEALWALARSLRLRGRAAAAYPFARAAADIPRPADILFVDETVYTWRALDELSVSAFWAGRYQEGRRAAERALASRGVPALERDRLEQNLRFCQEGLKNHA